MMRLVLSVRMCRNLCWMMITLFVCGGLAGRGNAQELPRRFTFDIGTGYSRSLGGGDRDARNGAAFAAHLGYPLLHSGRTALLVAINTSTSAVFDDNDCIVRYSGGSCVPNFPSVFSVSAHIGIRHRIGNTVVGAFAGPSGHTGYLGKNGGTRPGAMTRVDLAIPAASHAAFVVWGQAGIVPIRNSPNGVPILMGLGLRLQ